MIRRLAAARWCLVLLLQGCSTTTDAVGYNGNGNGIGDGGGDLGGSDAGGSGAGGSDLGGSDAGGSGGDSSDDTLHLLPLTGPASYPNAFRDVMGKTEAQITTRLDNVFEQLFHGDPDTEAIYFEDGERAYIEDILHGDVRTEGMGFGMMITVQLDRREEFDRLWRYAEEELQFTTGTKSGYFRSRCDLLSGKTAECLDPFGLQQLVMSLVFAHGRWGSDTGAIDYEAEALALFDVMRTKEAQNGGIVEGVTNTFDAETKLVFDVPNQSAVSFSRPAIEMPAYYELWAQATGDPFYVDAAAAARAYWKLTANPTTGLMPTRAYFDGQPLPDWNTFNPECYRTLFNITLDRIWMGGELWHVEQSNRLIDFFAGVGIDQYGRSYTLDGEPVQADREPALISSNGVVALISTHAERDAFIEAVWNQSLSSGEPRYYPGTLQLMALMVLGGRFRVY